MSAHGQLLPTGRHAQLWGGPEDGATVWLDGADLPARVGVHRTADGVLVPIRTRALLMHADAGHVAVYERAVALTAVPTLTMAQALRTIAQTGPLYLHRELVTRWAANT